MYPNQKAWPELCQRPIFDQADLRLKVEDILRTVNQSGDAALKRFSKEFDNLELDEFQINQDEIIKAQSLVPQALQEAIQLAYRNIYTFHETQLMQEKRISTSSGVECWRESRAIEKVGLYIPGGSAPLFSTVLMLGIPAKIAGCQSLVICSPPDKNGSIDPSILYTANLVGCKQIYKVGGAQAIAAMSYGTETIPKVDKIFGPGNQFVTKAKELVREVGIAIDMPAGPSEVLVIADKTAQPPFLAADLLSQAEHGPDSQVILLSDDPNILEETLEQIEIQVSNLPRKNIAMEALKNSRAILLADINRCLDFSNLYAPEHLIIASDDAEALSSKVLNAGSVFLGNYSCESAGDYASGTNHTLPTNAYARTYSGVSVDSFIKKITFQKIEAEGLFNIGPAIEIMAQAEGLMAHKEAVSIRLKKLRGNGNR